MKSFYPIIAAALLGAGSLTAQVPTGIWLRDKSDAEGLVKISVLPHEKTVQVWSRSRLGRLDWGKRPLTALKEGFTANWKRKGGYRVLVAEQTEPGHLRVIVHQLSCIDRPSAVHILHFHKKPLLPRIFHKYQGKWINMDRNTRKISRILIIEKNGKPYLHLWNHQSTIEVSSPLTIVDHHMVTRLNLAGLNHTMKLEGLSEGKNGRYNLLRVTLVTRNNARQIIHTETYYLKRL